MPVIGFEAGGDILGKCEIRAAFDGYFVVIIDADQFAQAKMSGQRCRLRSDAFHEIAVTTHDIGVVVDNFLIGSVENRRQVTLRHGHSHRVGKALPQRARRGLDAGSMAVFRMAGSFAAPLAKIF